MHVLGKLQSLERIFLDDWRPGADTIFQVQGITNARIRKMKEPNLSRMSGWTSLKEMWLHAGTLTDLSGLPSKVEVLELTDIRGLTSLGPLGIATKLQKLTIQGCKNLHSLEGLQSCIHLKSLGIAKGEYIESLKPLTNLKELEHLFIADNTVVQDDVDVLYALSSLKTLIISKKSQLDVERFRKVAPDCELRVAKL